jgi:TRAP-type mannitol/chloroaromatic compound transport system substrate-binding protein
MPPWSGGSSTPPNGSGRTTTCRSACTRPRVTTITQAGTSPGTTLDFAFNRKAYEALPVEFQRTLDHAAAAVHLYALTEFHTKNAIALERLRTEFKGKVEVLPLPVPVLRDLRKLAAEVVREESEKTPMARKVHASFTKYQALVGPWDHVAEGAYHQFVAG